MSRARALAGLLLLASVWGASASASSAHRPARVQSQLQEQRRRHRLERHGTATDGSAGSEAPPPPLEDSERTQLAASEAVAAATLQLRAVADSSLAAAASQSRFAQSAEADSQQAAGKQFGLSLGSSLSSDEGLWATRQALVRLAVQETWAAYELHAFGRDELLPLSLAGADSAGGLGLMILDSLDTLHLLGLNEEFERALAWVAGSFTPERAGNVSLPEAVSQGLGGLLAAHELTGEPVLLAKAAQLAAALLPAFAGSVFPAPSLALDRSPQQQPAAEEVPLALLGCLPLELWALARAANSSELAGLATFPARFLAEHFSGRGLLPARLHRSSGAAAEAPGEPPLLTVGEPTAQFYAAMLKMWLLTGRQEDLYLNMWQAAVDDALLLLLFSPLKGGGLLLGSRRGTEVEPAMDAAACALPGSIAAAALAGGISSARVWWHMDMAARLMEACWRSYQRTATGTALCSRPTLYLSLRLAPGEVREVNDTLTAADRSHAFHPAAAESLLQLWRATRDPKYRDMGWGLFQSLLLHARTPEGAFAAVQDVNEVPTRLQDRLPSRLLAHTLKALWLLFGDQSELDSGWVLSTAGHPLRVRRAEAAAAALL